MPDKQATLRQMLVITDGCSNVGEDPVRCAGEAKSQSVTVNVIGVVDKGGMGQQGREEAMAIAEAGGGMCRLVESRELSATAQMLTHQTMQMTLQQVVNQQLLEVMGKTAEELPPGDRTRVMQMVDKLEEEMDLELVVAVDVSASMRDKIPMVREAIRELALSLQARQGGSRVAVLIFPGNNDQMTSTVHPFESELDTKKLDMLLVARGGTPTGPAIDRALSMFGEVSMEDVGDYPTHRWQGEIGR